MQLKTWDSMHATVGQHSLVGEALLEHSCGNKRWHPSGKTVASQFRGIRFESLRRQVALTLISNKPCFRCSEISRYTHVTGQRSQPLRNMWRPPCLTKPKPFLKRPVLSNGYVYRLVFVSIQKQYVRRNWAKHYGIVNRGVLYEFDASVNTHEQGVCRSNNSHNHTLIAPNAFHEPNSSNVVAIIFTKNVTIAVIEPWGTPICTVNKCSTGCGTQS